MVAVLGVHLVEVHDRRVVELEDGLGFLLKASDALVVTREFRAQELDGDRAAEARVLGEVYVARAAAPEPAADAIAAEQKLRRRLFARSVVEGERGLSSRGFGLSSAEMSEST